MLKFSYVLDTRRATNAQLYPIKVRVGYNHSNDMYSTQLYTTKEIFKQLGNPRMTPGETILHKQATDWVDRIQSIAERLPKYSKGAVLLMLSMLPAIKEGVPMSNNILDWLEYKALDCIKVKASYGNAENYRSTAAFYKNVLKLDEIPFEYITPARLFEVQRTCHVDYALSTIGKYARHLRCIFNMAIADEFIPRSMYPFGRHKYVPPTSRKRKHALTREALQALLEYKATTPREQYHLDLFTFSFFANGLNLKDVATMRYRDMGKDRIVKLREKTINSAQEPITIKLTPQLRAIIERHGNKDKSPDNYVFPLLQRGWNEEQVFLELKSLRGKIKRTLTAIGKTLSIAGNLPHGTSRHCFANALKQSGASDEYISETIGHSSVAVTKHYTSNFEEDGFTTQDFLTKYTTTTKK